MSVRAFARMLLVSITLSASPVFAAAPTSPATLIDCTRIASASQRLACFDRVVGTPSTTPVTTPLPTSPPRRVATPSRAVPESIATVAANERARRTGDLRFRISESVEPSGHSRVVISAPALNAPAPRPVLALSCIDRITRLQLIVHPPLTLHQAQIALVHDGRAVVPSQPWRVLEHGRLIDAGRGLAGIEVIRRLGTGTQLALRSNLPALNGLRFDSTGLDTLIDMQRKACAW